MDNRPFIDAGPCLNFFAINQERLLFQVVHGIYMPAIVKEEVERKARQQERFRAAAQVLAKVPTRLLQVLSDEPEDALIATVERITHMPYFERMRRSKDLGEAMVVAYAVVLAEQGKDVVVIIDDREGRGLALLEKNRLNRMRLQGKLCGSLKLLTTPKILEIAVQKGILKDKEQLRQIYDRMKNLDDGLLPLTQTRLMNLFEN